jgi:hypothetical protein
MMSVFKKQLALIKNMKKYYPSIYNEKITNMSPIPFIVLNCIFFVLILITIITDKHTKIDIIVLPIIVIIASAQIIATTTLPFMGLEYEDSYVFSVHAKRLYEGFRTTIDPLQTHVCVLGSLRNCELDATSGGHLTNMPSITTLFHYIFGYNALQTNYNNIIFSAFSSFIIYLTLSHYNTNSNMKLVLTIAYLITPAIGTFHASALSETVSAFYLCVLIYSYSVISKECDNNINAKISYYMIICVYSFTLMLLTKRDNSAAIALPIVLLLYSHTKFTFLDKNFILSLSMIIVFIIYYTIFNFLGVEADETIDINAPTFSVTYLVQLVPIFIEALINPLWFSFIPLLSFYGALITIYQKNIRIKTIPISLMTITYFIMYCSHYRGYYFIKNGYVESFEALRYVNNFYPLIIILASFALNNIINIKHKISIPTKIITICFLLSTLISFIHVWKDWTNHEADEMISPAKLISKEITNESSYLMTDIPLVFQLFGSSNLNIIDQN